MEKLKKIKLNKIYCMDCLEGLKLIPDNSIDLVITDPPYGDGIGYGRNNKEILNNEDETINYLFLKAIYSKMKDNTSLYLFSNWKFIDKIRLWIQTNTEFNERMLIIMVKNNIGMGYGFRNQYELCLVLEKGKVKYNLNNFSNVYHVRHIQHDESTHPHTKDEFFIQKLIKHSSKEGDIILDGFMGSGTTAVACKQINRNFIGFELSQEYCDIANKRLLEGNLKEWFKEGKELK